MKTFKTGAAIASAAAMLALTGLATTAPAYAAGGKAAKVAAAMPVLTEPCRNWRREFMGVFSVVVWIKPGPGPAQKAKRAGACHATVEMTHVKLVKSKIIKMNSYSSRCSAR